MKLRIKTLLIIGVTLAGLIAILYIVSSTVLMSGFAQVEEQETRENVQRALDTLTSELDGLSSITRDYASWDDTYAFIEDANETYPKVNLVDATFSNLKLNLMVFVHSSGRIVFSKAFDLQNEQEVPLPDGLEGHLSANSPLLRHPDAESTVTGLVLLPGGPLLVASRPILTSEGQGPIHGTLIMARHLDEEQIERLSQVTHVSLSVRRFEDRQMPSDFQAASAALSGQAQIVVRPLSADLIGGYTVLDDVYGRPALLLRADVPRDIYQQGRVNQRYLIASVMVAGLMFAAAMSSLLEKLVLSRLARLSAEVSRIGNSGDLSMRVMVTDDDELSRLAGVINHTLSALERSERSVRESEERYRLLFRRSPVGIFHYDTQLRVTDCNDRFVAILQSTRERLVGLDMNRLQDQSVLPALRQPIEGKDGAYEGSYHATTSSAEIWASMRTVPLFDAKGQVQGGVGIVEDLTERKQAEAALHDKVVALQALAEIDREVTAATESQGILDLVCRCAAELVRARKSAIVIETPPGEMRMAASHGLIDPAHSGEELARLWQAEVVHLSAVGLREALAKDDITADAPHLPELCAREGVRAYAVAPLAAGETMMGALVVLNTTPRAWSADELQVLSLLAGQAAIALDKVRLFEETRERAEQLALLYEAGLALNRELDPHAQLRVLFEMAMKALRGDRAEFFRFDAIRNELRFELGIGYSDAAQDKLRSLGFSVGDERGVLGQVSRERTLLYVPDVSVLPDWVTIEPELRSGLWAPVEHEAQLRGVLSRTSKVLCTFQKGPYPLHLAHSVREVRCRVANSTGRGPIH